jgi:hypothetical protein
MPYMQTGPLRLYGRAGVGCWTAKASAAGGGASTREEESGCDTVAGAGVEYALGRTFGSWSLRADWMRHYGVGKKSITGKSDIDTAMIGLVLRY